MKLSKDEAAAVVASDPKAEPTGHGLGRHGWVRIDVSGKVSAVRWTEVEEWIRTSYTLVAPKKLARQVLGEDGRGEGRESFRPRLNDATATRTCA